MNFDKDIYHEFSIMLTLIFILVNNFTGCVLTNIETTILQVYTGRYGKRKIIGGTYSLNPNTAVKWLSGLTVKLLISTLISAFTLPGYIPRVWKKCSWTTGHWRRSRTIIRKTSVRTSE